MVKKNKRGITLIALVIAIIILIILAGISINLLLGENGIITRSKNAKEQHEYAAAKEIIDLKLADIYTDAVSKNEEYTMSKITTGMTEDTTITIDEKYFNATGSLKTGVSDSIVNLKGIVVSANQYERFKFLVSEKNGGIQIIGYTTETVTNAWATGDLPTGFIEVINTGNVAGAQAGVGESTENILRKYILGADEKGRTAFTKVDAENGFMSISTFKFVNNSTISNASTTIHYVTMCNDEKYGYIYFKYDEDGTYYRVTYDLTSYKTIALDDIYTPAQSSNVGRTLTYNGKSYTIISENGTDLEVVANYISDPVTIGESSYTDALTAYNSAITTLNSVAVTASGLSVDGTTVKSIRSIGNSGNGDNAEYFANPDSTKFSSYVTNSAKATDLNYEVDMMKLHNIGALSAVSGCWLASRVVDLRQGSLFFCIRCFNKNYSNLYNNVVCYMYPEGNSGGYSRSGAVRPVVTLNSTASGITWND